MTSVFKGNIRSASPPPTPPHHHHAVRSLSIWALHTWDALVAMWAWPDILTRMAKPDLLWILPHHMPPQLKPPCLPGHCVSRIGLWCLQLCLSCKPLTCSTYFCIHLIGCLWWIAKQAFMEPAYKLTFPHSSKALERLPLHNWLGPWAGNEWVPFL